MDFHFHQIALVTVESVSILLKNEKIDCSKN